MPAKKKEVKPAPKKGAKKTLREERSWATRS